MQVVEEVDALRRAIREARTGGKRWGFVPTMGALHAGHLSLIEAARRTCDAVAVSIFVNPLQFGPREDLSRYPRPRDEDLRLCREAGADLVFYPPVEVMYPAGFQTYVTVEGISDPWEGEIRPGHFRGVTTIVLKLLNLAQPDEAFFGQKDFQQQRLIRQMVRDLDVPTVITTCPTVRESDGLAMSSRNAYLNPTERRQARQISQALFRAEALWKTGERSPTLLESALRTALAEESALVPDYAVAVDPDSLAKPAGPSTRLVLLVAARLGTTRLIDNLVLE